MIIKEKAKYIREYYYIMSEIQNIKSDDSLIAWQRQVCESDRYRCLAELDKRMKRIMGDSFHQLYFDLGINE